MFLNKIIFLVLLKINCHCFISWYFNGTYLCLILLATNWCHECSLLIRCLVFHIIGCKIVHFQDIYSIGSVIAGLLWFILGLIKVYFFRKPVLWKKSEWLCCVIHSLWSRNFKKLNFAKGAVFAIVSLRNGILAKKKGGGRIQILSRLIPDEREKEVT